MFSGLGLTQAEKQILKANGALIDLREARPPGMIHLAGVNRFWLLSIQAGLRGEPTRLLASFDPVRVPAAMVEAARGASTLLARL